MTHIFYHKLASHVKAWRNTGYACADFPALSEILDYQVAPATHTPHFLRTAQLQALETYWYLRVCAQTPRMIDLYRQLFPDQHAFGAATGLTSDPIRAMLDTLGIDAVCQQIGSDANFAHQHHLEALRETLTLAYPSYILALAMGAGKTVLIGTIIASEFAMALEYPDGPFVQNALVFAPGKTILTALREILSMPYDRVLPPHFAHRFIATARFTFTRDGDKDLPVINGSFFNVVVTNSEKICIRQESIRKRLITRSIAPGLDEAARAEIANLRLQTLASLPGLAVFSDEAHHTYGQALNRDLKRVRQTIDYLHQYSPNLVCVVNTTGTPYFKRHLLPDVVSWYGLSQGIADGILKEVTGSIYAYDDDDTHTERFISEVVSDFFRDYATVCLPDGAVAKLAIYFPQVHDLEELQPVVERALVAAGQSPTVVLRNTSRSTRSEIDAFERLNEVDSLYRVILLVNKGTEGWNCPSLFACALARKLTAAHTFVLQAATRCLRQVPGNYVKARIYLSQANRVLLERQFRETYGEALEALDRTAYVLQPRSFPAPELASPPVQSPGTSAMPPCTPHTVARLRLERPADTTTPALTRAILTLTTHSAHQSSLTQVGSAEAIVDIPDTLDRYQAAVRLATIYRLDVWVIFDELTRLYGEQGTLPIAHLADLARQIEVQVYP